MKMLQRVPVVWYPIDVAIMRYFTLPISGTLREGSPRNLADWSVQRDVRLVPSRYDSGPSRGQVKRSSPTRKKYMFEVPEEYIELAEMLDANGITHDIMEQVVNPAGFIDLKWAIVHGRGIRSKNVTETEYDIIEQYVPGFKIAQ